MFEELETHILDIFNNLNTTKDVFILRPEDRKGIQIIFKHVNVRCSIRIYPTTSEHLFLYINGHHQQYLSGDKVVENFREDFLTALSNYHNQRYTAPLEGLIEWQQTIRLQKNNYLNIGGNYIPKNLALNDYIREEQLFELPTRSFAEELKTIASTTLKEKKELEEEKKFQKSRKLGNLINLFVGHIVENFKKDALRKSYKGEFHINYSLSDLNLDETLLKDFEYEQVDQKMNFFKIKMHLNKILEGFRYTFLIKRMGNTPTDIIFKISWNHI